MNTLIEFSNQSSLDHVNINVRWLKEWKLNDTRPNLFIFPYTAFWIVLSGTAVIELNHTRYTLKQGDIVSIPSKSAQSWKEIGTEGPFHYLSFACEAKTGMVDFIRSYQFPEVVTDVDQVEIDQLVEEWRSLAREYNEFLKRFDERDIKSTEKVFMSASMGEGITFPIFTLSTDQTVLYLRIRAKGTLWVQQLFQTLRSRLPDHPIAYDNRVFEVCAYVEQRLHDPPTLDEMASFVSLSKEHLRKLFQASYGLSPMQYVKHVRLQHARDLLLLTSFPIKDIASRIGYEDQHHFSRAFQQSEGMSPKEYRRRTLQGGRV